MHANDQREVSMICKHIINQYFAAMKYVQAYKINDNNFFYSPKIEFIIRYYPKSCIPGLRNAIYCITWHAPLSFHYMHLDSSVSPSQIAQRGTESILMISWCPTMAHNQDPNCASCILMKTGSRACTLNIQSTNNAGKDFLLLSDHCRFPCPSARMFVWNSF